MRKVMLSIADGEEYAALDRKNRPARIEYAMRHGYTERRVYRSELIDTDRPPSWWKLETILRYFCAGADLVLWLDADVEILRFDKDIVDHFWPEDHFGVVVHQTKAHGTVPNAGVWVVRKSFAPYQLKMNRLDRFSSSPHVWEQAALVSIMGGNHDKYPIVLPEKKPLPWTELPYEWNQIDSDLRGVTEDCRFYHAVRGTR